MKKKGFFSGFGAGILTTALVLGLGVSAFAASRTISVDDNIRVTINGAVFSPKDANGKDVAFDRSSRPGGVQRCNPERRSVGRARRPLYGLLLVSDQRVYRDRK